MTSFAEFRQWALDFVSELCHHLDSTAARERGRVRFVDAAALEARVLFSAVPVDPQLMALVHDAAQGSWQESAQAPAGITLNLTETGQGRIVFIGSSDQASHLQLRDGDLVLSSIDQLVQNPWLLQDGDTLLLSGGEHIIDGTLRIVRNQVTIASVPGEMATLRHGSFVYDWGIKIEGDHVTVDGIEFVGHVDTPTGRLYSHKLFVVLGDHATVSNCIFRHNSNYLSPDQGGDIAFGQRVDRNGNLLSDVQQRWGRLVAFEGSQGSLFTQNVVVVMEANAVAQWRQGATSVEGLMINNSQMTVEYNQFGSAGHQMLSSRYSTLVIRHNSFGDTSDYAQLLGMELSEYVRIPATHTAVALFANNGTEFSHNVLSYNQADPADSGVGLQIYGSSYSDVFNNLFVDSGGTGHGILLGTMIGQPEAAYNRVHHNTFINVPGPISVGYYGGPAPAGGNAVHHNEISHNLIVMSDAQKNSPHASTNVALRLNLGDPVGGNGNRFVGNLLYDQDTELVVHVMRPSGGFDAYTAAEFNNLAFAHDNFSVPPVFANPFVGDFRLLSDSVATQDGRDPFVTVATDLYGNPRSGAGYQVGAFDLFRVRAGGGGITTGSGTTGNASGGGGETSGTPDSSGGSEFASNWSSAPSQLEIDRLYGVEETASDEESFSWLDVEES